jgi:hypothetical protein
MSGIVGSISQLNLHFLKWTEQELENKFIQYLPNIRIEKRKTPMRTVSFLKKSPIACSSSENCVHNHFHLQRNKIHVQLSKSTNLNHLWTWVRYDNINLPVPA